MTDIPRGVYISRVREVEIRPIFACHPKGLSNSEFKYVANPARPVIHLSTLMRKGLLPAEHFLSAYYAGLDLRTFVGGYVGYMPGAEEITHVHIPTSRGQGSCMDDRVFAAALSFDIRVIWSNIPGLMFGPLERNVLCSDGNMSDQTIIDFLYSRSTSRVNLPLAMVETQVPNYQQIVDSKN